jgi:hypothetical protein
MPTRIQKDKFLEQVPIFLELRKMLHTEQEFLTLVKPQNHKSHFDFQQFLLVIASNLQKI